ncbi:isochorismate synthase MenF [Vibrio sp. SCSIO 43136]|uniref:isochorismate synthase n=1 Tax=Vibrio sp. SCSIO 43136 TaxID=2819101 RepID=UPI002074FB7F|nr:isochorismate synthase MenF [Vibrio sp. SCSIO 43136]USD64460.1 isochorismate synthase MenF [Vibrio sp. SCSIO 43136]
MSHFEQTVNALIERINSASSDACRVCQPFHPETEFSFIDWLEAQPHYPKFYWQSRDTREEVVALGQEHVFAQPAPAYAVLGEGQRVWGGRSFDCASEKNRRCMGSFFFLPQVELTRYDDALTLSVNLNSGKDKAIQALRRLVEEYSPIQPLPANVVGISHTPNYTDWCETVDDALQHIQQGEFKKVVLARRTDVTLDCAIAAAQLLKASANANHHSFHFLMALDSKHAFIGSTPERLYSRYGTQLYTEALAGTIGRGVDAQEDMALANWLSQDKKNLQENQYVVDDILQSLTPHAEQLEVQQETRLIRLRKVQHLKREIQAELKAGVNGVQLLAALQPTAAVAGLPREDALAYIAENEAFARGWYAGSVGFISHERAEFCVAIRSALVLHDQIQLFAGAGIVPGSDSEFEWQELDRKMSTLLSLLTEQSPLGVAS